MKKILIYLFYGLYLFAHNIDISPYRIGEYKVHTASQMITTMTFCYSLMLSLLTVYLFRALLTSTMQIVVFFTILASIIILSHWWQTKILDKDNRYKKYFDEYEQMSSSQKILCGLLAMVLYLLPFVVLIWLFFI